MQKSYLSQPAINAMLELAVYAVDHDPLFLAKLSGIHGKWSELSGREAKNVLQDEWLDVDWFTREGIHQFLRYVEIAYRCPKTQRSPHSHFDTELSKVGLKLSPKGGLSWIVGFSVTLPEYAEKPMEPLLDRAKSCE